MKTNAGFNGTGAEKERRRHTSNIDTAKARVYYSFEAARRSDAEGVEGRIRRSDGRDVGDRCRGCKLRGFSLLKQPFVGFAHEKSAALKYDNIVKCEICRGRVIKHIPLSSSSS